MTPTAPYASGGAEPRYGLIQIASRQVLPNVMLALPLLRRGWLHRHMVLHSDDPAESERPAAHLTDLLARLPTEPTVAWSLQPVDAEAGPVWDAAREEIDEVAAEDDTLRWILHATGGTKPMAWGLMQLAGHPRVAAVVYRDLASATWREVRLAADGRPDDRALAAGHPLAGPLHDATARLDAVPLRTLLLSQLAAGNPLDNADTPSGRARPQSMRGHDTHLGIDVERWLVRARSGIGFAAAAPSEAHPGGPMHEGSAFECWCAHALRALGATQSLWGVVVNDAQGASQFEFDVVACHGDRVLVIDTKLVPFGSVMKTAEIRTAAATARNIAGLGVTAMVLRPNWKASAVTGSVAEANRVRLVTRSELADWPRLAAQALGLPTDAASTGLASTLSKRLAKAVAASPAEQSVFPHQPRIRQAVRHAPPMPTRTADARGADGTSGTQPGAAAESGS